MPDTNPFEGFNRAGTLSHRGLNIIPASPPPPRKRHRYGNGPFAKLAMPKLPAEPGVYIWEADGRVVYVGQTRGTLASRLGSNGYSTISTYNTFEREPGRRNGGQQTNCRVNALANAVLCGGGTISVWYMITTAENAGQAETAWMARNGKPEWNRRLEVKRV
jgi:hypothetical protein